jgi:hypothetical protein
MKLDFTQINGKEVKVTDMEFLYSYTNDNGEKISVFEFEGEKFEKKCNNKLCTQQQLTKPYQQI